METLLMVGPPNVGKSSLFNLLSGKNRKVANYAGITVDVGQSEILSNKNKDTSVKIVDLPGIYDLIPQSTDETVTVSTILRLNNRLKHYKAIILVIDPTRLESSLALALMLDDLVPDRLCIVANKCDLLATKNQIDWKQLEKILRIRILPFSADCGDPAELDSFIRSTQFNSTAIKKDVRLPLGLEQIRLFPYDIESCQTVEAHVKPQDIVKFKERYQREARKITQSVVSEVSKTKNNLSKFLDNVFTHPFLGPMVFFGLFYLVFHSLYTWASPLMDLVETGIAFLGESVTSLLPSGLAQSFIVDGLIAGVGAVVVFLPQIMILFFLLSLLEDSGLIARAALMMDRFLSPFGISGKSFLPLLSGHACAIPGIMATRTIADRKEKMATLLVLPLTTCSARLPVYILLIGTFIPETTYATIFHSHALALFGLYFAGAIFTVLFAKVFRLTFLKGPTSSFFLELPYYHLPSFKKALQSAWLKGSVFLKKAGTVILFLSMLMWVLSSFPHPPAEKIQGKSESEIAAISLEHSYVGKLGKTIEPVIKPLGYDWKIGVGLLIAFGARELFVGAMGTLFALGDVDEENSTLRDRLRNEKDPITNTPLYDHATAWSLLIFFVFAMQCLSTLAIVKKETGGYKWPAFMFLYMGLAAYIAAFVTFSLLKS